MLGHWSCRPTCSPPFHELTGASRPLQAQSAEAFLHPSRPWSEANSADGALPASGKNQQDCRASEDYTGISEAAHRSFGCTARGSYLREDLTFRVAARIAETPEAKENPPSSEEHEGSKRGEKIKAGREAG